MFRANILIFSLLNKDIRLSTEPVITGNTMIISSNNDINDTQHIYDLILKNNISEVHIEGDEIENISSFRYIDLLKTIKISASKIKEIPDNCFSNCQNLQYVELNAGIEKIGKNSFEFTSISKINLENIKVIDDYAFKMCINLQNISLPLIETMGIGVFQSSGIKSLIFSDKITEISEKTAYNCLNLTNVSFGDNITMIGDNSFYNCINLENVQFKSTKFESIGKYSFYNTKLSTFPFHKNIKFIYSNAFAYTKFQSIDMPTTVVNCTIYDNVFSNLNNLEKISFGDYYFMNAATGVLMNCGKLKSVTIGQEFFVPDYFCYFNKNLEIIQGKPSHIIGQYAFTGCTSLKSINIEEIKIIQQNAFQHCHQLKINSWPDNSLTIGDYAFQYCDNLEISEIKKNYELSDGVFEFCQSIKVLTIQSNSIGSSVFHGCLNLNSLIINSSFNDGIISERSFYQCYNLETVQLSDKIYEISEYSFAKTKIREININNIRTIGEYSFMDSKITKLTIFGINQISNFAFHNSSSLTDLTFNNTDANFNPLAFTYCFNMKNFNFINSKLEFKEKMLINKDTMILLNGNDIKEYNVPEHIKEIQSFCFILSSNLEKLKIDHFVTINSYSFANSSIEELHYFVDLPGNEEPKEIKNFGFSFMEKVEKIEIPREITTLPESCFENCPRLSEIDLSNIQKIPQNCFKNSGKLTSVTFSNKLLSIGFSAFEGSRIKKFDIPDTLTELGNSSFMFSKIKSIKIGKSLVNLNDFVFSNTKIEKIIIPQTLLYISSLSFVNSSVDIKFENDFHPIFRIENNSLIEKSSNSLILTFGKMPMIYSVPSSVKTINSFALNSKYDVKKSKNQILFEKDFGTVVLKVPSSVLNIEADALSSAYYLYSVCYNGSHNQDQINSVPKDFLSNFFVTENYLGTTFFGYPLTGLECDESIPDPMLVSHVIGNTKMEKILSVASISLSSICIVAIIVLIVVIYYYKKIDNEGVLLSNYYSVDNKINSFYT